MKERLRSAVRLLYGALPKARYAVVYGWPDHEDSALALEQALQATAVRRVVLLVGDPRSPAPVDLGPKTRCVRKDGPAGWLTFAFARYVFFTHRCFMRRFPPGVVSVNVWHGMPIKRIGWMLEGDEGIGSRHALATSAFWAEIMDEAMRPAVPTLVTGLPRNDRLFLARGPVWSKLGLDGRPDVRQLVTWLPTFRRSVRGTIMVDGSPTGSPFEMPDIDPEALNALLAAHGAVALVKPHPLAATAGRQTWSHLQIVDDAWLRERRTSLYELLAATDVLVSDVSSVTVDFLLLDRPIVHALADLDAYGASRGFSHHPVTDLLMGPVATSAAGLLEVLAAVLGGDDPESDRRRAARERSHAHLDAGATARLLDAVGLRPLPERA